jgi:hypothetical protein
MKYNLIIKYSTIKTLVDSNKPNTLVRTDTIPQSIVVSCDSKIQPCSPVVKVAPVVVTPAPVSTVIDTTNDKVLVWVFVGFAIFFGAGCCIFCICYIIMRQRREEREAEMANRKPMRTGGQEVVELEGRDGTVDVLVEERN